METEAHFSWLRIAKIMFVVLVIAALMGTAWLGITSRRAKIAYASFTKDDHEHFLPCEQLPFLLEVQQAIVKHSDIVSQIKQLGASKVEAVEVRCLTLDRGSYFIKGDMLINYQTRTQRTAIEKLIGDNFFGIAYRGEQTN